MLISDHSRKFEDFNFVYPVLSRRAKGVSIGINCTSACSFNCVYCQSAGDCKSNARAKNFSPLPADIISELKKILSLEFENLKDIAFSGDGEPTLYPHFEELCREVADLKAKHALPLKFILITNAVKLASGLEYLDEIWGKLDAGTDEWLNFVNRPAKKISISQIEDNLKFMVSKYPLRIQTMLCEVQGKIPSEDEIESYSQVVERVYEANPKNLLSVQLYSVARKTAEDFVKPLPAEFLENVKKVLENKISKLCVEVF